MQLRFSSVAVELTCIDLIFNNAGPVIKTFFLCQSAIGTCIRMMDPNFYSRPLFYRNKTAIKYFFASILAA
jgi:hypothetical protein